MKNNASLTARHGRYYVGIDDGFLVFTTLSAALETINAFRVMFYDMKRGVLK